MKAMSLHLDVARFVSDHSTIPADISLLARSHTNIAPTHFAWSSTIIDIIIFRWKMRVMYSHYFICWATNVWSIKIWSLFPFFLNFPLLAVCNTAIIILRRWMNISWELQCAEYLPEVALGNSGVYHFLKLPTPDLTLHTQMSCLRHLRFLTNH